MRLSITAPARRDIDRTAAFYSRQRRNLGAKFIEEVDRMLAVLKHKPWLGQGMDETYRRIHLRKFPYTIIYKLNEREDTIRISTVCHQRRRPGYWRSRVEELIPTYVVRPAA